MPLNQVTLGTTDLDASVAFYLQLGMRLIVSWLSEYARFELLDGETALFATYNLPSCPDLFSILR